jgi:hypothetical protein
MGTKNQLIACPKCGKRVQSIGLGGHMWGAHAIKVGQKAAMAVAINLIDSMVQQLTEIDGYLVKGELTHSELHGMVQKIRDQVNLIKNRRKRGRPKIPIT